MSNWHVPTFQDHCAGCEVNFNLCETGKQQLQGFVVDGFFAEYAVVESRNAIKLPNSLDLTQAAPLFCAGITGEHIPLLIYSNSDCKQHFTACALVICLPVGGWQCSDAAVWDSSLVAMQRLWVTVSSGSTSMTAVLSKSQRLAQISYTIPRTSQAIFKL
jgi:hypothetical protein